MQVKAMSCEKEGCRNEAWLGEGTTAQVGGVGRKDMHGTQVMSEGQVGEGTCMVKGLIGHASGGEKGTWVVHAWQKQVGFGYQTMRDRVGSMGPRYFCLSGLEQLGSHWPNKIIIIINTNKTQYDEKQQ